MSRKTRADYLAALQPILEMFTSGAIPEATERALLVEPDDNGEPKPMARWSFNNQLLGWANQTGDARTVRQWNAVGRKVTKGSKAFYIWAPIVIDKIDKQVDGEFIVEDGKKKPRTRGVLIGYRTIPEFRIEDTSGEPVPEHIEAPSPDNAPPLLEVAQHWGIAVEYGYAGNGNGMEALGSYIRDACTESAEQIDLRTHDVGVFVHALAHAAHVRVAQARNERLADTPHWKREIVAEVAAAALVRHVGLTPMDGHAYPHITAHAKAAGVEPLEAVMGVLRDVKDVLGQVVTARAEAALAALAGD